MTQTLPAAGTATLTAPGTPVQQAMTLAALSYVTPFSEIEDLLEGGTLSTGTDWTVVWGPSTSPLNANMMYVAYSATLDTYAAVIRGMLVTPSLGTLLDVYEVLDVTRTTPWTYPPTQGAVISNGSLLGLRALLKLADRGQSLTDFLTSNVIPSGSSLWVVGHSLGGCLVTVLAPYLQNWLDNNQGSGVTLTPWAFAGPTAGNQAFASFYAGLFGGANCYFNDLDMVPMAWQNLAGITGLFSGGPACPQEMQDVVAQLQQWLSDAGVSYAQPTGETSLSGSLESPPATDWFSEVAYQHCHNTYLTLLQAQPLPIPCSKNH